MLTEGVVALATEAGVVVTGVVVVVSYHVY